MNEDLAAFGRALEEFLKIFRQDVYRIVDSGSLPIAYLIAFREPKFDEYETIHYIARRTRGAPPGLKEAFREVVHKWAAQTYDEFTSIDEAPVSKH
ncbi:MAG: hypothetical protein JSV47_08465 [Deltaproteobacteria bacterium]|nr:MAG: hypothetical protein JSV47_08465 [Deltaproteobacteria bacterium]